MKKLIAIILAIIMTLFSAPNQGADQPPVTAEKTPQTEITTTVEKYPKRAKSLQNGVCERGGEGRNNDRSAKE